MSQTIGFRLEAELDDFSEDAASVPVAFAGDITSVVAATAVVDEVSVVAVTGVITPNSALDVAAVGACLIVVVGDGEGALSCSELAEAGTNLPYFILEAAREDGTVSFASDFRLVPKL